jgi:hypothetical protein
MESVPSNLNDVIIQFVLYVYKHNVMCEVNGHGKLDMKVRYTEGVPYICRKVNATISFLGAGNYTWPLFPTLASTGLWRIATATGALFSFSCHLPNSLPEQSPSSEVNIRSPKKFPAVYGTRILITMFRTPASGTYPEAEGSSRYPQTILPSPHKSAAVPPKPAGSSYLRH